MTRAEEFSKQKANNIMDYQSLKGENADRANGGPPCWRLNVGRNDLVAGHGIRCAVPRIIERPL